MHGHVLRLRNLDLSATPGQIRTMFKQANARPEDIHLILDKDTKTHIGEAFVVFRDMDGLHAGKKLDGIEIRNKKIAVVNSSPQEFNDHFPGVSMISPKPDRGGGRGGGPPRGAGRGIGGIVRDQRNFEHPRNFPMRGRGGRGGFRGARGGRGGGSRDFDRRPDEFNRHPNDFDSRREQQRSPRRSPHRFDGQRDLALRRDGPRDGPIRRDEPSTAQQRKEVPNFPPRRRGPGVPNDPPRRPSRRDDDHRRPPMDVPPQRRQRSRSPVSRSRPELSPRMAQRRHDSLEKKPTHRSEHLSTVRPDPLESINERKFVQMSGGIQSDNPSQVEIQDFFRPTLTRDVFFCRNSAGKTNGVAIVEFFSESDARIAMKLDGNRSKSTNKPVKIVRPRKDEIMAVVQRSSHNVDTAAPAAAVSSATSAILPDLGLDPTTASNPQVQQLLSLLSATVTSIAAAANKPPAISAVGQPVAAGGGDRAGASGVDRDVSVINRVAVSANINVDDISAGRVVGIRNLPFQVTPDNVLDFFHGYETVSDSVRIHYLEDGRCSGDAIISFRTKKEAQKAVTSLNKKQIGKRSVDLFFL